MAKTKKNIPKSNEDIKAYCIFCGSTVGQTSDANGGNVDAIFACPKCENNYCNQ